jgi:hypothetical protein
VLNAGNNTRQPGGISVPFGQYFAENAMKKAGNLKAL